MKILHSLESLISRLLPARQDNTVTDADRLLVIFHLITLLCALFYAAYHHQIGFRIGEALMWLCFASQTVTLVLFRMTGRYRLCANLFLGAGFVFAVLGGSYYTGGPDSAVTPWFSLVPVISVLLLGLGLDTLLWVLTMCAIYLVYIVAHIQGHEFPSAMGEQNTHLFQSISTLGLLIILTWVAYAFGSIRSKALSTIMEQKEAIHQALVQIEQLAFHDALTHLPNRRLFLDRLGHAAAESKRNAVHGALLFLDLDNFKPLNDNHGHEAGDLLLLEAAKRLSVCMRESDTVARFGGDEFAVILYPLDTDQDISKTKAETVARKIATALAEPYVLTQHRSDMTSTIVTHTCTASIGVALFRNQNDIEKEVIVLADEAMYEAKRSGRNSIYFHPGSL